MFLGRCLDGPRAGDTVRFLGLAVLMPRIEEDWTYWHDLYQVMLPPHVAYHEGEMPLVFDRSIDKGLW